MNKLLALLEMLICLAGINVCFGLWSVKQERIVKFPYNVTSSDSNQGAVPPNTQKDYFTTTFMIGLSQTVAGLAVGLVALLLQKLYHAVSRSGNEAKASAQRGAAAADAVPTLAWTDLRQILSMGFTNAFGTSLGYAAMRRLPYPVALAAKMSKMVPVMVVGVLWYGRRYPAKKVASCLLLTGGVISFYLLKDDAHHSGKPSSSSSSAPRESGAIGFLLILINLIMDGFTNSTQDELVRRRRWSSTQLMVCANAASTFWLLAVSLLLEKAELPVTQLVYAAYSAFQLDHVAGVTSAPELLSQVFSFHDFSRSVAFLKTHGDALKDLCLMSLMNALGQTFIFRTIASFGGLAMTGMTLVRKAGSIILSIFIHGHVLNGYQWAALAAILAGVIWDGWLNISSRSHGSAKTSHGANKEKQKNKKKSTNAKQNQAPAHQNKATTASAKPKNGTQKKQQQKSQSNSTESGGNKVNKTSGSQSKKQH